MNSIVKIEMALEYFLNTHGVYEDNMNILIDIKQGFTSYYLPSLYTNKNLFCFSP